MMRCTNNIIAACTYDLFIIKLCIIAIIVTTAVLPNAVLVAKPTLYSLPR